MSSRANFAQLVGSTFIAASFKDDVVTFKKSALFAYYASKPAKTTSFVQFPHSQSPHHSRIQCQVVADHFYHAFFKFKFWECWFILGCVLQAIDVWFVWPLIHFCRNKFASWNVPLSFDWTVSNEHSWLNFRHVISISHQNDFWNML